MRWIVSALLLFVLIGQVSDATARTVKVCVADEAYAPFSFPDREGPGQFLVRTAIERQGDIAEFSYMPWRRCLRGMSLLEFDAQIGPAPNESFFSYMAFPMKDGKPDAKKSLGSISFMVFRRAGSRAGWNGDGFENLAGTVFYGSGIVIVRDKLAKLGVPSDESAKTTLQLMRMQVAQHADVVLLRKHEAEILMQDVEFKGKIEMLPTPFVSFDGYLAVRRSLQEAEPTYVNKLWEDIGHMRAAPDWNKTAQKLLAR